MDAHDSKDFLDGSHLPDGVILGNYEVRGVLGQGGFGITYWAIDTQLGREVVLKEHFPQGLCRREEDSAEVTPLSESMAADYERSLDSFCKEARIIAALNHPGAVHIHDLFQALGTAYIVMDYVEGNLLTSWLKEHGRETDRVRKALVALLDTLSYLHSMEVFHRDIKPSNIIVTADDAPVLLDFGSALEGAAERTITVMASPKYSPPEQYDGHGKIGPWSDLFALGRTFIVGLGDYLNDYPPQFREALRKATRLEIKERFQTAAQWQAYLEAEQGNRRTVMAGILSVLIAIIFSVVWIVNKEEEPPVPPSHTIAPEPKQIAAAESDPVKKGANRDVLPKPEPVQMPAEAASPRIVPAQTTEAHSPQSESGAQADSKSYAPDTLVGLRMQTWCSNVLQLNANFRELPLSAQFYLLRDYRQLTNWMIRSPFYPEGIMAAELIQFKPDGRWNIPKGKSGNYGYIKMSDTQGVVVFEVLDEYDETSLFYFYLYFTERGKGVAIAGDGAEYTLGNIAFELSTDNLDLVKRKIPESTDILFPYLKDESLTKAVAPNAVAGRMVQFDASEAEYCLTSPMQKGVNEYNQQKFYKKALGAALQSRGWRPGGKLPMTESISFIDKTEYAYLSEKGWYICNKLTEKRIGLDINRPDGKVDYYIMEFVKPGEGVATYYGGGDKVIRNIRFQMNLIPKEKGNDIAPDEFFKGVIKKLEKEEAEFETE